MGLSSTEVPSGGTGTPGSTLFRPWGRRADANTSASALESVTVTVHTDPVHTDNMTVSPSAGDRRRTRSGRDASTKSTPWKKRSLGTTGGEDMTQTYPKERRQTPPDTLEWHKAALTHCAGMNTKTPAALILGIALALGVLVPSSNASTLSTTVAQASTVQTSQAQPAPVAKTLKLRKYRKDVRGRRVPIGTIHKRPVVTVPAPVISKPAPVVNSPAPGTTAPAFALPTRNVLTAGSCTRNPSGTYTIVVHQSVSGGSFSAAGRQYWYGETYTQSTTIGNVSAQVLTTMGYQAAPNVMTLGAPNGIGGAYAPAPTPEYLTFRPANCQ